MSKHAGRPKHAAPHPKPKRSRLAKATPSFLQAFLLTVVAGLLVGVAWRYHLLDAWQWDLAAGPSIYIVSGLVAAGFAILLAANRGGRPAFWGATTAVGAALGVFFFAPMRM